MCPFQRPRRYSAREVSVYAPKVSAECECCTHRDRKSTRLNHGHGFRTPETWQSKWSLENTALDQELGNGSSPVSIPVAFKMHHYALKGSIPVERTLEPLNLLVCHL